MNDLGPATVLVTRDPEIVEVTSLVVPEQDTAWRQTFTSALGTITHDTRVLVVDAEVDAPMARLLAALFLDRQPGRSAVLIEPSSGPMPRTADPRIQIVARPVTPRALHDAMGHAEEFTIACSEIEKLATGAHVVPASVSVQPALV